MEKRPLKPAEILDYLINVAQDKVAGSVQKLLILGIVGGVCIAFSAEGSNMAAFNLLAEPSSYGLGKVLAGAIFGTGLMMVLLAGGELFLGNTMILAAVCQGKVRILHMLRNWIIVYIGNFLGAVFIAYMMVHSGLFASGGDMLGAVTLKIAAYKVGLGFHQAFLLGMMCNWLVCLAIWAAYGADTVAGKIFSIFFPIWLFITSGFENSVANMYYVPAGIMIKANASFAELSQLSQQMCDFLTWENFILHNLIPVTLGNIVGGGVFVGMAYWYVYQKADDRKKIFHVLKPEREITQVEKAN